MPRWNQFLVYVWWVVFFVLISALNIKVLVKSERINFLEEIQWPVNFLLFLFALWNFYSMFLSCLALRPRKGLSESLLVDDERPEEISRRSKLGTANFLSKLSFSWINHLLELGFSKPLVLEDIPRLVSEDEAISAFGKFSREWTSLQSETSNSNVRRKNLVISALFRVFLKEMLIVGSYTLVQIVSTVSAPLLLYAFVRYSDGDTKKIEEGLFLVGFLVVVKVAESLSQRHYYFDSRRTGMKMRSALMVAVYEKQLRLSSMGRRRHSTGAIVNYIAVDAYRMGDSPMWFHMGWSSFLQILLAVGILLLVVGVGALPGLVPLFICGLLNVPFAKSLQKCQSEFMVAQDKRLRSTSEILNSMKIIKLQSWEENFKQTVESFRATEFKWLSDAQHLKLRGTALYWLAPTIVSSVIFLGCVFFKNVPLDASSVFTILATLRIMSEPVRMLPEALSQVIQVKVSLDRINSFLLDDEIKPEDIRKSPASWDSYSSICVSIQAGNFKWDPESATSTLSNVTLDVNQGRKIAVCGPVGSGKSSLIYAILGEIPKVSGTVNVFGSVACVSQSSWIQSGTIRDNILCGKPMDKEKYVKAIRACALDKDISSFDHGDLTEIGQRGLNMSGGQKQRIQLARAVYNDADIYLLDDPFSAVDAHTAAILFNECVMDALETKTVVLVTHQVEFLSAADKILVMEDGKITQSGNYKDLLTAGTTFENLVTAHKNALMLLDSSTTEGNEIKSQKGARDGVEETSRFHVNEGSDEEEITRNGCWPGKQLTEEEERETGDAEWKTFLDYTQISNGFLLLFSCLLAQACFVTLQGAASYWLAFGIQIPELSSGVLVGVYAALSTMSALFVCLRSLFSVIWGLKASKAFFNGLSKSIFNAPMLFFDSTPDGRILTRFSSDLGVLDYDIPFSISFAITGAIELLASIGIMASITWQVLFIAIIALAASIYFQRYYQASARELMRINGTTKAPVMNYAAETSLGVSTIRAFNMVEMFFENYLRLVDTDAKLFLYSAAAQEWLILRVEMLQNLTLFSAALLLVVLPRGHLSPGLVGLSLSYALMLANTQVFLIRWYSSFCNYVISVERIKQFMNIPPEPPAIIEDNRPPASWPSKGRIDLHDLEVRYRKNAPLVLTGITCSFKEGTRVGVVGRTGSGKTTLISALFRLVEPDAGRIIIDGIDICSIGLKDLRMKLSIIPQEPTLFKGSIRTNLDPFGEYSDDEIWKALEKCQLKETVRSLPTLLDASVGDEGENWSLGQRQLFCLGRVLLRRNRVLVLDEATASIDSATDVILQKIIREEFSNCTVITIAHRVPTVVDSDMVMVLSSGMLVEYGEPSKLLEMNSSFSKLVAEYWSSCRNNSIPRI